MRWISRAVVRYPVLVLLVVGAITAVLYSHIHFLRMGTDLTEMFGRDDPQWRVVSQLGRELGYGNQLFVLVEAGGGEDSSGPMEEFADHLIESIDRKSTRLNSSHLGISYAVFCLKKKK